MLLVLWMLTFNVVITPNATISPTLLMIPCTNRRTPNIVVVTLALCATITSAILAILMESVTSQIHLDEDS
jgi:hypothetical protein